MDTWAHDVAMSHDGGDVWQGDNPACRVVRNARTGQIEGIAVWNPKTRTYDVVRLTEPVEAKVGEAFTRLVAESVVDSIWPVSGAMKSREEVLTLTEAALQPRTLIGKLAEAAVEVAALHAGFPVLVARGLGELTDNLCREFLIQGPAERTVDAVECLDFAFEASTGDLIGSPGLREITIDEATEAIDKLLGPSGRHTKLPFREPRTLDRDGLKRDIGRQRLEPERAERRRAEPELTERQRAERLALLRAERQRLERERAERQRPERRGPEMRGPDIGR
jgi:hypothetical protein